MPDLAVLVVTAGPLSGKRIEVDTELVIGREGDGLTIEDTEISRRHATVRLEGGVLKLEDLGSLNGTFVNGRRIESETTLHAGDLVKVGQTSLEVDSVPEVSRTVLSAQTPSVPETRQQARPAPAPSAPPPAAPATPPPQELGAFAPATPSRRRSSASRRLTPAALTFTAIAATALALIVYFAQH